jgi:hypothetical protein
MYRPLINAVITADEIPVDKIGSNFLAVIPFAESDDGETVIALECNARKSAFEDRYFYEFSFCISVTPDPNNSKEIAEIWTPEVAGQFIPTGTKKLLLTIVGECYKAFIREIDKMPIYRVTYGSNPSEEALRKHKILTAAIEGEGYVIEESGTDDLGRSFWMMVRHV